MKRLILVFAVVFGWVPLSLTSGCARSESVPEPTLAPQTPQDREVLRHLENRAAGKRARAASPQ
ncbi:MAG: hypothetical protein SFU56_00795 [Capsulimonadales bacterium]|nr:hypothetical protein [Capsulimonadales bacterium]